MPMSIRIRSFGKFSFFHFFTMETSLKLLCEAEENRCIGNPTHIGRSYPLLHISPLSLLSCAQMCVFGVQRSFPFPESVCALFLDLVCLYISAKEAEWKDSLPSLLQLL